MKKSIRSTKPSSRKISCLTKILNIRMSDFLQNYNLFMSLKARKYLRRTKARELVVH